MKTAYSLFLLLLLPFSAGAERLQVLNTFAPIDSLTRNVAGDVADVAMLLPPGVGPHDYAMSPGDLKKIAGADVIVINGLGMEEWLDKTLKNSMKKGAVLIDTSKGVKTLESPEMLSAGDDGKKAAHDHDHHHDHDHGHHHHGGINPHIWLDPILAIGQVEAIRDGLSKKDPANAAIYSANAKAFVARLRDLDKEIRQVTNPLESKELLTFHDAFVYFANRYGFKVVGVFEPFPGKEPTPKYLQQLKTLIQKNKVRVLFSEPQYSPSVMTALAKDLGLPVAALDTMEVGKPSAGLYETTMRANLETLRASLNAQP